jgi:hypothetical protein
MPKRAKKRPYKSWTTDDLKELKATFSGKDAGGEDRQRDEAN